MRQGQLGRQAVKTMGWGRQKKRDRKQMEKAASSKSGGSVIDLDSSSEEEEQTHDYFGHACKCKFKMILRNQTFIKPNLSF
jgi:hypothetical protein